MYRPLLVPMSSSVGPPNMDKAAVREAARWAGARSRCLASRCWQCWGCSATCFSSSWRGT